MVIGIQAFTDKMSEDAVYLTGTSRIHGTWAPGYGTSKW